jgi:hypothetical protein
MRNPPEEGDSSGYYQLIDEESIQRRGFHPKKGIPLGITSLFTRIQASKIKICGKFLER